MRVRGYFFKGFHLKLPNEDVSFCYTVVSVYEVNDVVETILKADPSAIINTYKTEHFYGKFYIPPI